MNELQVRVDYDNAVWVAIDPRGQEPAEWAIKDATLCWQEVGVAEPGPDEVSSLATLLLGVHREVTALAERTGLDISGFLHLPSPERSGALALLTFADADGQVFDRDDLAMLAGAGEPDLVEPPTVTELTTSLGPGVRVRALTRTTERKGLRKVETVTASVGIAWWVPDTDLVVKLQLTSDDLEQVVRAEVDFDRLAEAVNRQ